MAGTSGTPTRQEVLETVLSFVNYANSGDLEAAAATHSDDCVVHYSGMPDMNMDAWRPFFSSYFDAFPDLQVHVNPEEAIIEGDRLAGPYTLTGTHSGSFMGMPPTGKRISVFGINIFRVRDGKIVEETDLNDALGMLQQLGVIPAPGAAPVG